MRRCLCGRRHGAAGRPVGQVAADEFRRRLSSPPVIGALRRLEPDLHTLYRLYSRTDAAASGGARSATAASAAAAATATAATAASAAATATTAAGAPLLSDQTMTAREFVELLRDAGVGTRTLSSPRVARPIFG